jgi:lipoprotein-releasing system permease protein
MDETMNQPHQTAPFAAFEWMLSARYLRARRKEGFISVIAGFSFLGIMLGVATLIIVMAVMNGFRKELLDKILGLNGHILVQPLESPLTDWKDVAERISQVQGIRLAAPVVDGQALASSPFNASGVFVRGIRAEDLNNLTSIAKNIRQGTLEGFDEGQGVAIGRRLADQLSLHAGDSITLVSPKRRASSPTRSRRCSKSACPNTTRPSCSCPCRRRRPISTASTTFPRSRSSPPTPTGSRPFARA